MIHSSLKVQAYWCQGNFDELLPPYPIVATSNTSPMCSCRRLAISRVMRASPVGAETASEKIKIGIFSFISFSGQAIHVRVLLRHSSLNHKPLQPCSSPPDRA